MKPDVLSAISAVFAALIAAVAAALSWIFARSSKHAYAKESLTSRFLAIEEERQGLSEDGPSAYEVYTKYWLHQHDQLNLWLTGLVPADMYYSWLLRRLADWHDLDAPRCALYRAYYLVYRAKVARFPDGSAFAALYDKLFSISPVETLSLDRELRNYLRDLSLLHDSDLPSMDLTGQRSMPIPHFMPLPHRVALSAVGGVDKSSVLEALAADPAISAEFLISTTDPPLDRVVDDPFGRALPFAAASLAMATEEDALWRACATRKHGVVLDSCAADCQFWPSSSKTARARVAEYFRLPSRVSYDFVLLLPATRLAASRSPEYQEMVQYWAEHAVSTELISVAGHSITIHSCGSVANHCAILPAVEGPALISICTELLHQAVHQRRPFVSSVQFDMKAR